MSKMLKVALDMLSYLAKKFLPPVYRLVRHGLDMKSYSLSWAAHCSRRFGGRAIMLAGLLATLYAVFLFAMSSWSPSPPKASHDVILKTRFSSPLPSSNIVIVDIDERSLAAMSEAHGRWPWSRDVLADGLQKLVDLHSRAVLFNVMMSDADKNNPDADAAMDATAQMNPPVAFPLIRLNPKNDSLSQLRVTQIPGVVPKPSLKPEQTVAVILPMFASMHDRLGVANQMPDDDGIVREYPLRWQEADYTLPSMVQRTAELGGASLQGIPDSIAINWRNKHGRYSRVSFSDLLLDKLKPEQLERFKDAYVVLSLSAPGLGQTKATSVAAVEDDGEILATALDDSLHSTYLRTMPAWTVFLINLLTIWGLVWFSLKAFNKGWFNKAFVLTQSGLGGITLLSASYTNYLIDLSECMSFGLSVFAVIKLIQSMDDRWSRARPGFRRLRAQNMGGQVFVLGYLDAQLDDISAKALQQSAEKVVGFANVVRVDDLVGGESFVKGACARFKCFVVHVLPQHQESIQALLQDPRYLAVSSETYSLSEAWDTESKSFAAELAPKVLACGAQLLNDDWISQSVTFNAPCSSTPA